jgi:hypothetical protein
MRRLAQAPNLAIATLWVHALTQAQAALRDLQHRPQRRWHCGCGELVEGGFDQCWQCGAMMPAA